MSVGLCMEGERKPKERKKEIFPDIIFQVRDLDWRGIDDAID